MSAFEHGLPPPVSSRPPSSAYSLPPLAVLFPTLQGSIKPNPVTSPFGYITIEMVEFAAGTVYALEQSDGLGHSAAVHDARMLACYEALEIKYRELGLNAVGWQRVFPMMVGNFGVRLKYLRNSAAHHNGKRVSPIKPVTMFDDDVFRSSEIPPALV